MKSTFYIHVTRRHTRVILITPNVCKLFFQVPLADVGAETEELEEEDSLVLLIVGLSAALASLIVLATLIGICNNVRKRKIKEVRVKTISY